MWRGTGTSAGESNQLRDLFEAFPGEEVFDDFFHDVVLSTRDFTDERLTIRIQVYDLDGVDEALVESVTGVASGAAVLFPQLAAYAGLVGLAAGPLVELVNNVDDHDPIVDERVTLEVAEPETRRKLLQPGYYVCFKNDVEGDLVLEDDLRVTAADGDEYDDASYAILQVSREYLGLREWEIDQKVAKLVAELDGKGQSGEGALHFLRQTLDVYTRFRQLQRATELRAKETLTDDEEQLLAELRDDPVLRDYLGTD